MPRPGRSFSYQATASSNSAAAPGMNKTGGVMCILTGGVLLLRGESANLDRHPPGRDAGPVLPAALGSTLQILACRPDSLIGRPSTGSVLHCSAQVQAISLLQGT